MSESHYIQKISILVVSGLFLGANLIPLMNGTEITTNNDTEITSDIAARVAVAKLQELNKQDFTILAITKITDEKGNQLFYACDLNPQGYIIVTGSYDLPPIIAYSFTSTFQGIAEVNPLFDLLSADMTLRLQTIQNLPQETLDTRHNQWDSYIRGNPLPNKRFEQWPPEGSTPTGGWLLTNWHQNAPYNNFCPLDLANGGQRSVAGCPSVVIAQILNYHNTTMNVEFDDSDDYYHAYGGNNYWIDNNYVQYGFKSYPQLNTYLQTLQSHYENQIPLTNDDKAAITFASGVAATQVYGAGGSGTFGVNQAYEAYQRFNCTTCSLLTNSNPDIYERMSCNIKDGLPVHLAVVNEGWTVGHNVVLDGYNTDNYYHVNFGWGGSQNGWYLIPEELPYELTVIEGVIVDILNDELDGEGNLQWTNIIPCEIVTNSFTITNIGDPYSNLNWVVSEWPSWGTWTFTPSYGKDLRPENGPFTVTAEVIAPNEEYQNFTGEIIVKNTKNNSDYSIIPVTLTTGKKIHEKLSCNGSLNWMDIKPKSTITGNFTVENAGASLTNLSWNITGWPDWGTWTFTPSQGTQLTPEDGPVIINVTVIAPLRRNTEFTGQITVTNTNNSDDFDTIPITLTTPYQYHITLYDILLGLLQRYPHAFPFLQFLLNS